MTAGAEARGRTAAAAQHTSAGSPALVVKFDGGARGNPGPAAAAAVAFTPNGQRVAERAATLGHATNNVAEYRGLLLGLDLARELGAREVELVCDSELVAKQLRGEYRVKNPRLRPLWEEAHRCLRAFDRWTVRSVPRAENSEPDALLNRALDASREGSSHS